MRLREYLAAPIAGVATALTLIAAPAAAQVDFSGERITLTVPYSPGGGADLYSRFLGPLIAERLPGSPTLVIENVPGAGAIAGSNQFQDRADADGTDLITASASVMVNFVFRDPRGHYELDKWIPIISSPQGSVVYVHSSTGIEEPEDLAELGDTELILGANNPTGGDLRVLLAMDLLGANVRPVFGMNRGDAFPAFQRGELTLDFAINNAYRELAVPMIEAGEAVPLFSMGWADEDGNITRDPATPELPHFLEVYEMIHGEPLSGPQRAAWDSLFGLNVMATRAILLPEGTPQNVVDTYYAAVRQLKEDMANDPELQAQAEQVMGDAEQTTGEAALRNVRQAVVFDDEGMEWLRGWLKENFDTDI